ncbi:MAG TPA: hypothetical protein PK752_12135, partial [Accumulibacter sp.]|uniref:hypothetical protein n=1 Tax=Accumulibacter sp. TaxID=2053492 RepID=UPI002D09B5FB
TLRLEQNLQQALRFATMTVDDGLQQLCHTCRIEALVSHDHLRQPSRIAIHCASLLSAASCVLTYVNRSKEKLRQHGHDR